MRIIGFLALSWLWHRVLWIFIRSCFFSVHSHGAWWLWKFLRAGRADSWPVPFTRHASTMSCSSLRPVTFDPNGAVISASSSCWASLVSDSSSAEIESPVYDSVKPALLDVCMQTIVISYSYFTIKSKCILLIKILLYVKIVKPWMNHEN